MSSEKKMIGLGIGQTAGGNGFTLGEAVIVFAVTTGLTIVLFGFVLLARV